MPPAEAAAIAAFCYGRSRSLLPKHRQGRAAFLPRQSASGPRGTELMVRVPSRETVSESIAPLLHHADPCCHPRGRRGSVARNSNLRWLTRSPSTREQTSRTLAAAALESAPQKGPYPSLSRR